MSTSRFVLAVLACLCSTAAQALSPAPSTWPTGNAWNGKSLYATPTTAYASYQSCAGCHGSAGTNSGDPYGKLSKGVNKPATINNAILNGTMTNAWLKAMSAQNLADVAAFLANPSVSGPSAAPVASVSPASLSFSQALGGSTAAQTVTVGNTGTAALVLGSITLAGAQAGDYAVASGGTCASGASIAVGANCTLRIVFTPAATGARSATLAIAHNAAASPSNVTLNGTGTASPQPVIAVNSNALGFAATAVGNSTTQSITVSNTGQASLLLGAMALSGTAAADYGLSGTCAANTTLAVGASCSLAVRFAPTATGTRTATLALPSNASNGALSIGLSGTATAAPAAAVNLSPSTQAFGNATVGGAAVTRSATLTNTGTAALAIASVAATGNGFSAASSCGSSLAAGASCSIALAFNPSGTGAVSGQLAVASNAPGSPHTVALSGTGVLTAVPVLAWSGTATPSFADTSIGSQSAPAALTLVNQGPGSATLDGVTVQGANAAEFVASGTCAAGLALPAGGSCTISIVFAPAQSGLRSASLGASGSGASIGPVALAGNGIMAAQPALSLSASTITFPPATVGEAVAPIAVDVVNSGTASVTLRATSFAANQFAADPSCVLPSTLGPGQTCTLNVSIRPESAAAAGELSDTLTLATDNAAIAPTVAVTASVMPAATPSNSNVGYGGCSIAAPGAPLDPLLWLLCAGAALQLWRRRRRAP